MKKLLSIFALMAVAAVAQITTIPPNGGGSGGFIYTGVLSGLPATCSVGQVAFITNATPGQNQYNCTSTNTWTQNLNSGAGGASTALDNLASVSINTALLFQSAKDLGSAAAPPRSIFFYGAGTFSSTSIKLDGTPTGNRVWTFPDSTDTVVGLAATQTLTNKTLTSPVLTTPTLGVASATTLNKITITAPATGATLTIPDGVTFTGPSASGTAATLAGSETLTNKTLTTPTIASFTNSTHTHTNNAGGGTLAEGALAGFTDVTTANATTSQHGLLLKLDGNTAHFLNGNGAWTTPSGGGGTGCIPAGSANGVLTDDGAGACTTTGVSIDGSNNISTAGGITLGVGGSVAGWDQFTQGTAKTPAANSFVFQAPTSISTAYSWAVPTAAGTGVMFVTDTSNVGAITIVGTTGSSSFVRATSPTLVTPVLGAATGTSLVLSGSLTSNALTSGRVPIASTSGILVDDGDLTFATDTLTVTKIIGSTSITDSGLTAGRVTFASTSGLLADDADLTFSGDTLTATKFVGSTSITDSGLTAGRVTFAGASGLLSDDSDLTFSTDTLTMTKGAATTSFTVAGAFVTNNIVQNSQSAAYTTVLGDAGKHIYHPGADTTARIWTIDSNANVAYPVGTCLTFVNDTSGGVITISITSDTMILAGAGTTGSRTLAASGIATACKMTSTRWMINGSGLT